MIPSPDRVTFDRITEVVYQGSRISTLDDYHRLRAHGVRACVDMKHEGADPWTFDAFLWLPTIDHDAPTQPHLRMGIAFLRQCERAKMPVFVHCMAAIFTLQNTLRNLHQLLTYLSRKMWMGVVSL